VLSETDTQGRIEDRGKGHEKVTGLYPFNSKYV